MDDHDPLDLDGDEKFGAFEAAILYCWDGITYCFIKNNLNLIGTNFKYRIARRRSSGS